MSTFRGVNCGILSSQINKTSLLQLTLHGIFSLVFLHHKIKVFPYEKWIHIFDGIEIDFCGHEFVLKVSTRQTKPNTLVCLFLKQKIDLFDASLILNGAHEFDTFDSLFGSLNKCLIPHDVRSIPPHLFTQFLIIQCQKTRWKLLPQQ